MATGKKTEKINTPILALIYCCTLAFFLVTDAQAVNITAFGDSITEGYGSSTGGYPPKLSDELNANGRTATVYNYGVGGENTWDGLWRIDSVLAATPVNIVLIMEGTNDIQVGLSVESTQWNLQGIIEKAKAAKVVPLISTLTPSERSGSVVPDAWNPMIKALAASSGIHLVDNYATTIATWGAINIGDGLHPNDDGYQIIANTWYTTLATIIPSSTSPTASTTASSGGGGGGGCFIATAAFGSPAERHVVLLREFRDTYLQTNALGRHFVAAYYQFSPPAADFISHHETLKMMVRVFLYPLITLCYVLLKLSQPVQLGLLALAVASCLVFSAVVFRRHPDA